MTPLLSQIGQFAAQIAPFAIVGVIVNGVMQYAKQYFEKSSHKVWLLVGISVVGGLIAYFAGALPENFLTAITGVLAAANTIYVLVVRWFENPTPPAPPAGSTSTPVA